MVWFFRRAKIGRQKCSKIERLLTLFLHHLLHTILGGVFIIFGWCGFLGGRKLDEKENWEVGDTECVGIEGKKD